MEIILPIFVEASNSVPSIITSFYPTSLKDIGFSFSALFDLHSIFVEDFVLRMTS